MAKQARWRTMVWGVLMTVAAGSASAGGHGRCEHHAGCRHGQCVPHCPVRPGQFGYHGTQWRRWPGSGVVPVSAISDAVPVRPPRSAVPGPEEESPRRTDDEPDAKSEGTAPEEIDGPVSDIPAASRPGTGPDEEARIPVPSELRSVDDPRAPSSAGPQAARPASGRSRSWRQFVDTGVKPTSSDEGAPAGGTSAGVDAAGDGAAVAGPPQATAGDSTRVAAVAFYPPRPPARQPGRPQRAAVPALGR